eukprot:6466322-Amphidinium_carterae.1
MRRLPRLVTPTGLESGVHYYRRTHRWAKTYANALGHPLQLFLQRHWQLHGHMLRHNPAFSTLLHTVGPTVAYLRREARLRPILRAGHPIRYNAAYLSHFGEHYTAMAPDPLAWARSAESVVRDFMAKRSLQFNTR